MYCRGIASPKASASRWFIMLIVGVLLAGCGSSQIKARKEQRDKGIANSKLWCEFVNGEIFPDIDVAVNLEMAKRCDSEKSFSITSYRTPSENQGLIYCCAVRDSAVAVTAEKSAAKPESKPDPKKLADPKADVKVEGN